MRNWTDYNEKLVRRGEILISDDCLKNWDKELAEMNHEKEGRKFLFPESFMKLVGYAKVYFGLPYRQTEELLRTYGSTIPKIPDYTAIHKRINRLDIKIDTKVGNNDDIVIAIDSTGIKVANRGEWMRDKWKRRRGFLKIHVGVDVTSKKIISLKITDERSHDAQHLPSLVEQASSGKIVKVLADAAYDSKNNFSYLYHNDIIPAIKVRKNSSGRSSGCYPRKLSVISQITRYQYWKDSVSYGKRWIVESVFSALKRIFGEHVMAHKRQNMVKELELKAALYNRFMSV